MRVISGFKMKAPMLPIENEPHFPDYFKDNQADSPGGNVVFPPVKSGRRRPLRPPPPNRTARTGQVSRSSINDQIYAIEACLYTREASSDEWFNDRAGISGDEPGEASERSFFTLIARVDSIGFLPSSEANTLCIHYSRIKTFSGNPN